MIFSASSVPRVSTCPVSAALPQVAHVRPGMRLGTAVHAFLEAINRGTSKADALAALPEDARKLCEGVEPCEVPIGLPEVPYAYDVQTGTARRLTAAGHRGYGVVPDHVVPGTIDLLVEGSDQTRWTVIDWSTDHDLDVAAKRQQVETYMLMVARAHGLSAIDGAIGSFRLSGPLSWHRWHLDAWGLIEVAERVRSAHDRAVKARVARDTHERTHDGPWQPDVVTGSHCRDCRALIHCPATTAAVRAVGDAGVSIGDAYEAAMRAEKWAEDVRGRARAMVEAQGHVELSSQRRLVKRIDKNNRVSLRVVKSHADV